MHGEINEVLDNDPDQATGPEQRDLDRGKRLGQDAETGDQDGDRLGADEDGNRRGRRSGCLHIGHVVQGTNSVRRPATDRFDKTDGR